MNSFFKKSFLPLLALFTLVQLAACVSSDKREMDKYTIQPHFADGDKYLFIVEQEQNINSMNIASIQQNITSTFDYAAFVNSEGELLLNVTFSHLKFSSLSPAGEVEYDSDHPDTTSIINNMASAVGQKFELKFNENGSIKNILEKRDESTRPSSEDEMNFMPIVKNNFDVYPGYPVSIGETWQTTTVTSLANFSINLKSEYQLKLIQEDTAIISVIATLDLPSTTIDQQGYKYKVQISGKQEGEYKINLETGIIISGTLTQNAEAKVNSMGQSLPMTIHSVSKAYMKKQ